MAERKGGDTLKKVEYISVAGLFVGLLFEAPAIAIGSLLVVTGAEGYKYYQKSRK